MHALKTLDDVLNLSDPDWTTLRGMLPRPGWMSWSGARPSWRRMLPRLGSVFWMHRVYARRVWSAPHRVDLGRQVGVTVNVHVEARCGDVVDDPHDVVEEGITGLVRVGDRTDWA